MSRLRPRGGDDLPAALLGGNLFGYSCTQEETTSLLHAAQELGLTAVDTADVYGHGQSETFIGRALRHRRDRWFVATKAGVTSEGLPRDCGRPDWLRQKLTGSLKALSMDYLDLYQLHRFDPSTPWPDTLDALEGFRQQGLVRFYGLSNCNSLQLGSLGAQWQPDRWPGLVSLQCLYNLVRDEAEERIFPAARALGLGILAYGVLGRGVFSGNYLGAEWEGRRATQSARVEADLHPDFLRCLREWQEELRTRFDSDLYEVALAFVLRSPGVVGAIVGTRTLSQLQHLVQALEREWPEETWAEVLRLVQGRRAWRGLSLGCPDDDFLL